MTDSTAAVMRTVLGDRPEVLAQLEAADAAVWQATDPELLDLCRIRIAMLLGCADEIATRRSTVAPELVADLSQWPSSPRFDARQRAALAYTEQHVVDVAGMDDPTVADLVAELGPDATATFANALLVVEQRIRLRLAWEALLPEVAS